VNKIKIMSELKVSTRQTNNDFIRIFIAATSAEWLPARVLEFSIREKTNLDVEIQYLYQSGIEVPVPHDIGNKPRTPFSFQRFLIPELCKHSGRAIYLDADMQVFHDISGLWNQSFSGCDLQTVQEHGKGRKGQFSVMLLDCERLHWDIKHIVDALDDGELDYSGLMYEMKVASNIGREIDSCWNSLETFEPEVTSLLHYTDMNTQPWISLANPLSYLWISCLRRALSSGYITREEIEREVDFGHVRPSLIAQLATEIDSTIALPRNIKRLDRRYSAPYKQLNSGPTRPWTSIHRVLYRVIRRGYYSSPLPRLFLKK